jgi:hypothetical protein
VGDFMNENGVIVGNDGIKDGKLYVIKTSQSKFEGGAPSAGITPDQASSTEDFIRDNSGNTDAFQSNDMAYKNSVEIESNIKTRSEILKQALNDDGTGGANPLNNQEHYGKIGFLGEVFGTGSGPVADPARSGSAESPFAEDGNNYKSRFHTHPRGTSRNAQGNPRHFIQPPSPTDISNAGHRTNYVFGRGEGKTYIYNGTGIQAVIPTSSFGLQKR